MESQKVLITGGSSGIGKATALAFAAQGAKVLITGRNIERLEEVAKLDRNVSVFAADSADPASAELIIGKAISLWGSLDVLINNAGAGAMLPLAQVTEEQITQVFNINVIASSLLTKAALPYLRVAKGSVINVSSAIGSKPTGGLSHYGASKAALDYLTKAWALELAPDIRVNSVSPGPTESGALTGMMGLTQAQAEAVMAQEVEMVPLKRRGNPEDVSRWIVMLANPASNWVTGQVIGVDGGFSM